MHPLINYASIQEPQHFCRTNHHSNKTKTVRYASSPQKKYLQLQTVRTVLSTLLPKMSFNNPTSVKIKWTFCRLCKLRSPFFRHAQISCKADQLHSQTVEMQILLSMATRSCTALRMHKTPQLSRFLWVFTWKFLKFHRSNIPELDTKTWQ